jgi:Dullard-like phosphatase family protein
MISSQIQIKMSRHTCYDNLENLKLSSNTITFPSQSRGDKGKLTVVLDLDETLIFNNNERRLQLNSVHSLEDYNDRFEIQVEGTRFIVNKRPGLDQFLEQASRDFELIAFTAGIEQYGRAVIKAIDPEGKYFRHRGLFRQNCTLLDGAYVKDLTILNRRMERIVLVDNSDHSFHNDQLLNGIRVKDFYDDPLDGELVPLLEFLQEIKDAEDVREAIRKDMDDLEK